MIIELAQEIPTSMLEAWSLLSDLDFILAHHVLADHDYAEFFAHRPHGREVILDNSYHELGYPLGADDLLEAAHLCRADYVIAPDRVGDPAWNAASFHMAKKVLDGYKIAVVMTGTEFGGANERDEFLHSVREADMLCCTFKQPKRFEWFKMSSVVWRWTRVHLLGVSELDELALWVEYARTHRHTKWSVDSGKAIKWALEEKFLDLIPTLRHNAQSTTDGHVSPLSKKILELKREEITPEIELVFQRNVQILRETCS